MSDTTAWRRERDDPEFAALKVQMGPHRYGARLSAVMQYIAKRPAATSVAAPAHALAAAARARAGRKSTSAPVKAPEPSK
ncbi:MAG: hypothetical protein M3Z31_12350 [Pseudomonadota bacterium]|nr:hypothetical protein [Pseudomonadota bacterium]